MILVKETGCRGDGREANGALEEKKQTRARVRMDFALDATDEKNITNNKVVKQSQGGSRLHLTRLITRGCGGCTKRPQR